MTEENLETSDNFNVKDTVAGQLNLDAVYDIPVQISVVLGKTTMTVNQLLKLSKGAVVELDKVVGDPVDVYVNNRLVAKGEVVIIEDRIGITLTDLLK